MTTGARSWRRAASHAVFIGAFLTAWQLASGRGLLDPTFFGHPLGIVKFLHEGFAGEGRLWIELGYTVAGTMMAFLLGTALALALGLLFAAFPRVERAAEPYLAVLNAMPRLALVPMFLLWFGLGLGSKVAVGTSLTLFIVLSSTIAGIRGVSADHVILSQSLGATRAQLFFKVTLPSAVPVIAAGLRLGLIYAMLGVIGAELIASEHGLGQVLVVQQSMFNMNGVMAITLLLAAFGMGVTQLMTRAEAWLLRWQ